MARFALPLLLTLLVATHPASGQTSSSYKQEEHAINQAGHPEGGVKLASASYKITLDAVGDSVTGVLLSSGSHKVDAGFPASYTPPGEVMNLRLAGTDLSWDAEPSRGDYTLYRGLLSGLPSSYGTPIQSGLPTESATDTGLPPPNEVYFYLVTVDNRLDEEGTKGFDSSGNER